MQTQLLASKKHEMQVNSKIIDLESKLKEAHVKELLLKTKIASTSKSAKDSSSSGKGSDIEDLTIEKLEAVENSDVSYKEFSLKRKSPSKDAENIVKLEQDNDKIVRKQAKLTESNHHATYNNIVTTSSSQSIDLVEAKIIGLATTYLAIYPPTGARLIDIWSYINNVFPNIKLNDLNEVLHRYSNLFDAVRSKENEHLHNNNSIHGEQKWKFIGFNDDSNTEAVEYKQRIRKSE